MDKHSSIATYYQPFVIRAALALKIHQYEDTGAILAASTTVFPNLREAAATGITVIAGYEIPIT